MFVLPVFAWVPCSLLLSGACCIASVFVGFFCVCYCLGMFLLPMFALFLLFVFPMFLFVSLFFVIILGMFVLPIIVYRFVCLFLFWACLYCQCLHLIVCFCFETFLLPMLAKVSLLFVIVLGMFVLSALFFEEH